MGEQNLPVIAAEDLVCDVNQSARQVNPHEGQVPLQGAAQPSSDGEGFGPVE